MRINWEIILSLVTASTAIIAIIQTQRQIKISNNQVLFEKRIEMYLIAKGLLQLYKENQHSLGCKGEGPYMAIEVDFSWLTNNSYLETITSAIDSPLKMPNHKNYLMKMEELKFVATKIKFLFSGKEANRLVEYILAYRNLLMQMYKYKILLCKMHEASEQYKWDFDYAVTNFKEPQQRNELISALTELHQAYKCIEMEKAEDKIVKQIKLIK